MRLIAAKDMGIAARDHGVGRRIKEYAVVADGKDAVEIVGDDHDGHAHVLLEFEDELVQQGGADRVEPGRRLVKENDFGVHRQRAGDPTARYSTLQDIDAKRHTEIDMFSGALMRMGKELGIPTPYNEYTYHMIKAIEEKNDGRFNYNSDNEELTWAK